MPGEVERGSLNNGSGNASAYPKTALNTVRVYKQRGKQMKTAVTQA